MKNFGNACALGALLFLSSTSFAVQTDNYGLHAVPLPGKVVIDGQLNDWDLSGQVLMTYDIESLRDVYSARVATMYDAENFYVSVQWKDPAPMGNIHDPRYQANKGWAGDALQMRFKTDRISHVTAWYYGVKQEPGLQIEYGKDLKTTNGGGYVSIFRTEGWKMEQGAEMAFKKDADGRGYVQEIKLPWKLITNDKRYGAGDALSVGFELLWGEADFPVHRYADNLQPGSSSREFFWTAHNNWGSVQLEPKGNLQLPEPAYMEAYRHATQGETVQGIAEITYDLPKDARVSLAINDAKGRRVRNLVPALPRKKGRNTEKWDGLDDNGNASPPGNYAFQAIYHDGIHAQYVMSFANPGHPTWSTSDERGAFYGDHTAPQAAAAAGNYVALATPMGEAGRHLIGTDLNGQRLWGLNNRVAFDGGQISLATDGKTLWVGTEGKKSIIYRVDIATGRYSPWAAKAKDAAGNEFNVLDLSASDLPGKIANRLQPLPANMRGIAYHDGTLAVALARENKVKLLDGQTGATLREYSIPEPVAVTFNAQGEIVALSGGQLMRLQLDGTPVKWSDAAFADGYGLNNDAAGNIYLSVRGTHQNVKVFSPQGVLLSEIGRRGGRPLIGPYDANAMRAPAGIAVDSQRHLWVTEETMNPKRTSVWETATGKLWKDLPGTSTYAGAGALNPFDPTLAFSDDTAYRLNLQTGASRPIYSLGSEIFASHGSSGASHGSVNSLQVEAARGSADLFPPTVHQLTSRVVKRGALTYIYSSGMSRTRSDTHVTLYDGTVFRSVAHFGVVPPLKDHRPEYVNDFIRYSHPFFTGHEGQCYLWTDANGDGLVQAEELVFGGVTLAGKPANLLSNYWGQIPDDEGTVTYLAGGPDNQVIDDKLFKFSIKGTNKVGAPIYDLAHPQVVRLDRPVVTLGEGHLMGGSDGRVYLNQDPLTVVEKSGKVLHTFPSPHVSVHGSHTARAARSGALIGPSSFLGVADMGKEIGDVFYLNGNLGENYLFTGDGLYIQTLFKDTRGYFDIPSQATRGISMDTTTAGAESFGGNFIKCSDGKTYLTLGATDARVMEVTGLDSIRRLSGKFSFGAAQYAQALELAQRQAAQVKIPKVFTVAKTAQPISLDGQATNWPELLDTTKALLEIQETPELRYGRVSARYDDQNLYLGYRVFSPRSMMKNVGQDDRLLFKSGDAVDLMIGPENSIDGAGNLRLLLTQVAGQPVAVLNQKVAPGARAEEKFDFSSPWRTISFDRVKVVDNVRSASGPAQGGYFVEAAIPWSVLGITPSSGLKLRGDVGVLFADSGGTTTVSRQYWSNKATGLVNDVPGEADLSPELWGTFVLE